MSRIQLKKLNGGVLQGMRRWVDGITCKLSIWWIGGIEEVPCNSSYPAYAPESYYPPETGNPEIIHVAKS